MHAHSRLPAEYPSRAERTVMRDLVVIAILSYSRYSRYRVLQEFASLYLLHALQAFLPLHPRGLPIPSLSL